MTCFTDVSQCNVNRMTSEKEKSNGIEKFFKEKVRLRRAEQGYQQQQHHKAEMGFGNAEEGKKEDAVKETEDGRVGEEDELEDDEEITQMVSGSSDMRGNKAGYMASILSSGWRGTVKEPTKQNVKNGWTEGSTDKPLAKSCTGD